MRNRLPHRGEFMLAVCLTFIAATAMAADFSKGLITVTTPWLRATPNGAPVAGGYMTIVNKGAEPDRLIGGSVDFAGKTEVHQMAMSNGVMTMRDLPGGLVVGPGATVELKPSSFHLMFLDLKHQLKQGDTASGSLTFEKAGAIPVQFTIESMGAQSGPAQSDTPKKMDMPMH